MLGVPSEASGAALLSGDSAARTHAIETSVRAKAAIVAMDGQLFGTPGTIAAVGQLYVHQAFALDPDGNNVEAVYHGPHKRSADAVHITW